MLQGGVGSFWVGEASHCTEVPHSYSRPTQTREGVNQKWPTENEYDWVFSRTFVHEHLGAEPTGRSELHYFGREIFFRIWKDGQRETQTDATESFCVRPDAVTRPWLLPQICLNTNLLREGCLKHFHPSS